MFKKASKMVARVNAQPVKVLFTIEVKSLALKGIKDISDGSSVNVCFERSGKLAATKDASVVAESVSGSDLFVAEFNQTLSLVVTLYRNQDGTYQEKTGKLIVRQPKASLMGGTSFKGIGLIGLNLHDLAASFETKKFNLQLTKCSEGSGVIETSVTSKFIGDADPEESGSNMSGDSASLSVTDAAEFEARKLGNDVSDTSSVGATGTSDPARSSASTGGGGGKVMSSNPNVMSSAAITVLQERCGNLQASLASKEEVEKSLRAKLTSIEEKYQAELSGLRIELDSTNASLRKEQSEKKILKLEKSELEVTISSLTVGTEAKITDAVARVRAEALDKETALEAELSAAQAALQRNIDSGQFLGGAVMNEVRKIELSSEKADVKKYKEQIVSLEEEVESLVSQIEGLKKSSSGSGLSALKSMGQGQGDYQKLREQCIAQEEEIQTLVAQIEDLGRKGALSVRGKEAATFDAAQAEVAGLRRELAAAQQALKQKEAVGGSDSDRMAVEIEELRAKLHRESSTRTSLEMELQRTQEQASLHESLSSEHFSELKTGNIAQLERVSSELLGELNQLRGQLDISNREKQQLQTQLLSVEHSSEVTVKELTLNLEETRHRAEKAEQYFRGQLDTLSAKSSAECTAVKEELEASKASLRREKDTSRSLQDKNNELQVSSTSIINHLKLSAQEKEAELRLELRRMGENMETTLASLKEELQTARMELRSERTSHSQAVIDERNLAERNLMDAIEAVKSQAMEMERDIKALHKEEIATKDMEIGMLQQLVERRRSEKRRESLVRSGSQMDLLSTALVEEVSLLKVTMVEYLKKGPSAANDDNGIHSLRSDLDDISSVEEREPEDGVIVGAVNFTIDDEEGHSHVISSTNENAELCSTLLSTLHRAINVLEHDPLDEPDGPYARQSVELEKTRKELAEIREQAISQKMALDSANSMLSMVRGQSDQLEKSLNTLNEQTLDDLRSENSELKSSLMARMEEITMAQRERSDLLAAMDTKQEELQSVTFSLNDAQAKISAFQARMQQMVEEYEEEGKRLRDLVQACREETAREVGARFDMMEAEKGRLEKNWAQSLALEREMKAKSEASLREHFERIISERSNQLSSREADLDACKLELRQQLLEIKRLEIVNSKGTKLMTSALEKTKQKAAESEAKLQKEINSLKSGENSDEDEDGLESIGNGYSSTGLDYGVLMAEADADSSVCQKCASLQADLKATKAKYRERTNEVVSLHEELQSLRAENVQKDKRGVGVAAFAVQPPSARSALSTDQMVNSALTLAREEAAEAMEMYIKTQSDLEALRRDHRKCQLDLETLQETHDTEMESSRWAVEAMTEATLKRADMEAQYDAVLEELIEFKLKCAELAEACDTEKAKVFNQKQRLMRYAERCAALEVQLNTRIF